MILHTVNKSPPHSNCLAECLRLCTDKHTILLIEDGVYAGQNGSPYLANCPTKKIYALQADVLARGLDKRLSPAVSVIDDQGFVDLVTQHQTVQSWY
ncbi:MAG: tRNA 2-thiouridine synthesizing protein B [Pseudohongiellaceae bacterium]|jgi:tRNA 2-thiouridine synthesizing protein B